MSETRARFVQLLNDHNVIVGEAAEFFADVVERAGLLREDLACDHDPDIDQGRGCNCDGGDPLADVKIGDVGPVADGPVCHLQWRSGNGWILACDREIGHPGRHIAVADGLVEGVTP